MTQQEKTLAVEPENLKVYIVEWANQFFWVALWSTHMLQGMCMKENTHTHTHALKEYKISADSKCLALYGNALT